MVYAVGSRTTSTLPETNMETLKGALKTTVLLAEDYCVLNFPDTGQAASPIGKAGRRESTKPPP